MSMGVVLFTCFVVFFLLSVPLPFAIALSSFFALLRGGKPFLLIAQRMFMGVDSFPMLAIPFFILSGEIMLKGGLSRKLINVANAFVGHKTAGLATVTVSSAAFFGAISGSAPATTASIGSIMVPEMKKAGYPEDFSAALVASVGALIMCSYIIARRKGFQNAGHKFTVKERLAAVKEGGWALMMPFIILGGIYGGVCTPTEAGGVVCLYALLVGKFIYKELKLSDMPRIFFSTVKTTAMVVFMVACANLFGWIMASEQLPARIVKAFLSVSENKYVLLFLVNVALLIAGALMDNVSAMTILCTVLMGIGSSLGIHPIHLGAIIVINFAVGNITPPVGYTLYIASSICGMPFERVAKNCLPMLASEIVVLMIITYIPFFTLAFL